MNNDLGKRYSKTQLLFINFQIMLIETGVKKQYTNKK